MPLDGIHDKRLILVLGKGGVGRTTIASAIALDCARRGRRTLLYQAAMRDSVSTLLGTAPIGENITPVREKLWAVNTNPNAALHEYGLMVLHYETVYRMVLENRVAKALVRAIPGLDDYSIIGKLWWHTTETLADGSPRWDTIVFDAPATGHAVTMLDIPRVILEVVPDGPLTRDATKVRALLEDPARTAGVIVTLAEEMPVNEAIELHDKLAPRFPLRHVVVNQLFPDRFASGSTAGRMLDALSDAKETWLAPARLVRSRRALHDEHLARLRARLSLPKTELPYLFVPTLGKKEVEELSRRLCSLPLSVV